MRITLLSRIAFIALLILLFSSLVTAIPGVAHQFYGSVTVNGKVSPDDVFVEGFIDGASWGSGITNDGDYGNAPNIFYVEDPDGLFAGKTITFFIAGVEATTATFSNGASTELNLAITCDGCVEFPADPVVTTTSSGSSGGGGGGGGGGGYFPPPATETDDEENLLPTTTGSNTESLKACSPDWDCTDWSGCINGVRKRLCVDRNVCDTPIQPDQEEECELTTEELYSGPEKGFFGSITGAVLGGGVGTWITLLIFLTAIGGVLAFVYREKLYW